VIEILQDWCKGCNICIDKCPRDALEVGKALNKKGIYPPVLKEDHDCNLCRLCELLCPDFAITVTPDEEGATADVKDGGVTNEV